MLFDNFNRFAAELDDDNAFFGDVEGGVGFANSEGTSKYVVNVSVVVERSVNGDVFAIDRNGELIVGVVVGDTFNSSYYSVTPSDRGEFLVDEADGLYTGFVFADFVVGDGVRLYAWTNSDVFVFSDFDEASFGVDGEVGDNFARGRNDNDIVSAVGVVVSVSVFPSYGDSMVIFVDGSSNVGGSSGSYDFSFSSVVPQEFTERPVAAAENFAVVGAVHFSIVVYPAVAVLEAFAKAVAVEVAESFAAIRTVEAADGECNAFGVSAAEVAVVSSFVLTAHVDNVEDTVAVKVSEGEFHTFFFGETVGRHRVAVVEDFGIFDSRVVAEVVVEEESFPAEAVVAITAVDEVEVTVVVKVDELSAAGAGKVESASTFGDVNEFASAFAVVDVEIDATVGAAFVDAVADFVGPSVEYEVEPAVVVNVGHSNVAREE